jgi:hypothetical protein
MNDRIKCGGSGSALILAAGSGSGSAFPRIQEKDPPKREKVKKFHVLKILVFSLDNWSLLL